MKLVKKKKNSITFLSEIEESLANALRRSVNQIPVLAIDEVEIVRNDSPLYDETIAHRIGLIPVKTRKTISEKNLPKFKLNVKREGVVYSKDLVGDAELPYETIPITILKKEQGIELSATTKLGKGEEHAKFSPGIIFYRQAVEIIVDKEIYSEIKKIFPDAEAKEKKGEIALTDNSREEIADACGGICESKNRKTVVTPTGELVITAESFGQMSVEDMIIKSADALKKELTEVSKTINSKEHI